MQDSVRRTAPATLESADFPSGGQFGADYCDVDEQAAALQGWNQSYQQLTSGAFRGSVHWLELGGVRLFIEGLQGSVYQTGRLRPGVLALGVPLRCKSPGVFCGTPCDSEALHVFSGPDGFEFRTGSGHVMLGIEVAPDLTDQIGRSDGGAAGFGHRASLCKAPPSALAELRQATLGILEAVHRAPALLDAGAVRGRMVDGVVERVAALADALSDRVAAPDAHWPTVRAARELVASRLQQPPTVADLCAELKVSRRTLQYSFKRVLGIGPLAFLRAARLGAARRRLKFGASVTDAATELGFWHFGHFARDYCAMFGELPSQTRRHAPLRSL